MLSLDLPLGLLYLLNHSSPLFQGGIPAITPSMIFAMIPAMPFWGILGLILILGFAAYLMQKQASPTGLNRSPKNGFRSRRSSLKFKKLSEEQQLQIKYFLGFVLLVIAIIYQHNQSLILDGLNLLADQPKPPKISSPWSWQEHPTQHPIIAAMPPEVEKSIKSVAQYIAKNELDPYLRIKAIHDYVISRLTYDLDVLKTGHRKPQDAPTVFLSHKAVCEGYANLFMALGKAMGEKIVLVKGKVRRDFAPIELIPQQLRLLNSNYDWTLHAWNAVKVAGNWQLVDPTWDDSSSQASADSYSTNYLMVPPEIMIISHLPELASWQLLHQPKTVTNFEQQPILYPEFFVEKLRLISPIEYQTKVANTALIEIEHPPSYSKKIVAFFVQRQPSDLSFWNLPESNPFMQNKRPDIKVCQSQKSTEAMTQISCQFPEKGDYQVLMFSFDKERKKNPMIQLRFQVL